MIKSEEELKVPYQKFDRDVAKRSEARAFIRVYRR